MPEPSRTKGTARPASRNEASLPSTGRIDFDRLTAVLTELCSPWPVQPGMLRIERALPGPFGPVPVQHHIAMWKARQRTFHRLRHEEIGETGLDRVRAIYRPMWTDYQARRPAMATIGAAEFTAYFAEPDTMEGRVIEAVDAFVGRLAGELGLIEAAFHAAETARLRLAR